MDTRLLRWIHKCTLQLLSRKSTEMKHKLDTVSPHTLHVPFGSPSLSMARPMKPVPSSPLWFSKGRFFHIVVLLQCTNMYTCLSAPGEASGNLSTEFTQLRPVMETYHLSTPEGPVRSPKVTVGASIQCGVVSFIVAEQSHCIGTTQLQIHDQAHIA